MAEISEAEKTLVTLLNRNGGDIGDSLHMIQSLTEGSLVIGGDRDAGVEDMVLGYEVSPNCELDDDGNPESDFSEVAVRIEVRVRGEEEGDAVRFTLPRDWNAPMDDQQHALLEAWIDRVRGIVSV